MKQDDRFRESLTALRQSTVTGIRVRQLILDRTDLNYSDIATLKSEIQEIQGFQVFVDNEIESLDLLENNNE